LLLVIFKSMIPQSFIEEIQQRTDIVELISSYIPLKRSGRSFKALCPFHSERTPSFFVNPQKQIFHCFGCGEGGGSLQFLMLYDKVSFTEAIDILAKRLGLTVPYQETRGKEKLKSLLYEVTYEASIFFYKNLISLKESEPALNYLKSRGITKEIIDKFRIGYAAGKNNLLDYMRAKNFTLEILEKASLVTAKSSGGYLDLFRDRVIFPIFDIRNRVVGFGARTLREKEGVPKYINSFENPLYSKRDHLFGLNFSKEEILKKDSVIVTEGYLDMVTPYQGGIRNIVANLGTALTLEQIRLVRRYTKNIILVFDADKAGQAATLRAVDLLLENGLNIRILNMPRGLDLDLAIREKGVDFVLALLDKRVDFFDYKVNILKGLYDIESIEGKAKLANQMLSTIGKLSSEIEKYEYIKKLSEVLKVKEEVLIAELRKIDKQPKLGLSNLGKIKESIPIAEKLILKFIFTNAKIFEVVKKKLNWNDFLHPLTKKTFSLIVEKFSRDNNFSLQKFLSLIEDKEISGFVSQVLMEDVGILDKSILKDCILKLRRNRARIIKENLKMQMREAEKDKNMTKLKELVAKYRKINNEVRNG